MTLSRKKATMIALDRGAELGCTDLRRRAAAKRAEIARRRGTGRLSAKEPLAAGRRDANGAR
jgi:hypothetical protein